MKCDASNNVKNVVNSLKIIYLSSACSECTPIYSSIGARQSASLAFYQHCLCFSPVLLSSAHVYALHACLSGCGKKRIYFLTRRREKDDGLSSGQNYQ